jgi:hypothetical protein
MIPIVSKERIQQSSLMAVQNVGRCATQGTRMVEVSAASVLKWRVIYHARKAPVFPLLAKKCNYCF